MGTWGRWGCGDDGTVGTMRPWGAKAQGLGCLTQLSLCNSLSIQHHEFPCSFHQPLEKEYVKSGSLVTATKYETEGLSPRFKCKNSMQSYLRPTPTPPAVPLV